MTAAPIHGHPRLSALLIFSLSVFSWSACSGDKPVDPDLAPSNDAVADEDGATQNSDGGNANNIGNTGNTGNIGNTGNTATNGNPANGGNIKNIINVGNKALANNGNVAAANEMGGAAGPANANQGGLANAAPVNTGNSAAYGPVNGEPPLDAAPPPDTAMLAEPNAVAPAQGAAPAVQAPPPQGPLTQAPLLQSDLTPAFAKLFWVGYDYLEKESMVRIEMVTRGHPKYNIFQERNQLNQPELVVRFFNTELRHKLRRDIDATEFRSPVAFVRLRPDTEEHTVDVIMTLRDQVQARLYNKNGNIMLTFPVPDRYFGNSGIGSAPVAQAQLLPNTNLMPSIDNGSELTEGAKIAKAFINDPGKEAFAGAPAAAGAPVQPDSPPASGATPSNSAGQASGGVLPADFSQPQQAAPTANTNPNAANAELPNSANAANLVPVSNDSLRGDDLYLEPNRATTAGPAEAGQDDFDMRGIGGSNQPPAGSEDNLQPGNEQLNDNKFDDFDDGKGNSDVDVDKFDVRLPLREGSQLSDLYDIAVYFTSGVAADDEFSAPNNANPAATPNNVGLSGNAGSPNAGDPDLFGSAGAGSDAAGGGDADGAAGNLGGAAAPSGVGTANSEALLGNTPAEPSANLTPAVNTGANAAPVNVPAAMPPVQPANMPDGEPPIDGAPDLAGQESEGAASDQNSAPSSHGGRPMKVDFRGAPLTEVIRVLSDESHVNFILPPELGEKKIFISLNGVPFNDALKAILDANALQMVPQAPNLVRIDTIEHFAAEKEAEERRRKAELKLRPTKILVHRLSYAKVEDAAKMLTEMLGGAAKDDKRIAVQIDVRTNSVIVNAPPGDLSTVKALLERIDLETPQVKIASRIVEVIKKFKDHIGIKWGTPFNFDQGRGLGFGNLVFPNYMLSRYSVDAGGGVPSAGNTLFRFGSVNNSTAIDLALAMEENSGTTEVLQSGNLIVEDNHEAVIVAGSSEFFRPVAQGGAAAVAGSLDEIKYNLSVKVTPHITADGAVQMALNIESDTAAAPITAGAAASKNNRSVNTSLLRRSGETAVIGGIYNTSHDKTQIGVPFLSSLPIIGALFRQTTTDDSKRELMVMVTPTILTNSKAFAASSGEGGGDPAEAPAEAAVNGSGNLTTTSSATQNAGGDNSDFGTSNANGGNSGDGNNGAGSGNAASSGNGYGGNGNAATNAGNGNASANSGNGNAPENSGNGNGNQANGALINAKNNSGGNGGGGGLDE